MEEYLRNVKDSTRYFTVLNYFRFLEDEYNLPRPPINERRAIYKGIGHECSSICDERNIIVEKEPSIEFKTKNAYPEFILAEVLWGKEYPQIFPLYSPYIKCIYPSVPRRTR